MAGVKLTFLGTGTSQGIPIIGCRCAVCSSENPHDKRYRSSALVEWDGMKVLVDAGPDFREQMLRAKISHLDAILLTHNHKDHTGGIDDVRALNYIDKRVVEIYCEEKVLGTLRNDYGYAFSETKYPGAPEFHVKLIGEEPFIIPRDSSAKELVWLHNIGYRYQLPDGSYTTTGEMIEPAATLSGHCEDNALKVIPIRVIHGKMPILGFRFGDIAYLTDIKEIPESEFSKLKGLKHLTLNTVGYKEHHSHLSLDRAILMAAKIGAEHTWLTHLSHSFPVHEEFGKLIESRRQELGTDYSGSILPAYDGLSIED